MAARAHDVAALCIKGNSAILNFPQLKDMLPRPASVDPRDVQAAAAKAAMQEFNSGCECSSDVPVNGGDEHVMVKADDELSELIELPSLEGLDSLTESTRVDLADQWMQSSWALLDVDGFSGELTLSDQVTKDSCFQTLSWDC
ncbi:dehydration-responsive element-binding protein 3-like [Bidens hawaiensis]|uniref:dehydration-responsive element-binding protein 3-like n=1 Tax=Bidens hawaiensis TaxID=980011 RepID=UPI00404AB809